MNIKTIVSGIVLTGLVGSGISSFDVRGSASAWVQDIEEPTMINENELDNGFMETSIQTETYHASGWVPNGLGQENKIYDPITDQTISVPVDNLGS